MGRAPHCKHPGLGSNPSGTCVCGMFTGGDVPRPVILGVSSMPWLNKAFTDKYHRTSSSHLSYHHHYLSSYDPQTSRHHRQYTTRLD